MIRLGIIGTGGMAQVHANCFIWRKNVRLAACCDPDAARLDAFAEKNKIPKKYADYRELIADGGVDAVCNVTPDAAHCEVALAALKAKKHILSEKPLAANLAEARRMAAAAAKAGVINMVHFSYRNSAGLRAAAQLVARGKIGRVLHVEASYLQGWLSNFNPAHFAQRPEGLWRLSTRHGSQGDLGDIGCHILDLASFLAGDIVGLRATLRTFDKGVKNNRVGDYHLDANDSFAATADFAGGGLGAIHSSRWATGQGNSLRCRVYGDKGAVEVDLDRSYTAYRACLGKDIHASKWEEHEAKPTPDLFTRFVKSIVTGKNDPCDFQAGLKVQAYLDACFASDREGGKYVKIKL